jgi:hypothetical protein
MTANFRLKAYQIYFDEISFNKIEKEFIPLDNRNSPRPDWFEFHVIRGFLKSAKLKKNSYYGFLSPRFREKTGLSGKDVHDIFNKAQGSADAILLTSQPEQIALHKNPFLQGEFYHPGLIAATEHFLTTSEDLLICAKMSPIYKNPFSLTISLQPRISGKNGLSWQIFFTALLNKNYTTMIIT